MVSSAVLSVAAAGLTGEGLADTHCLSFKKRILLCAFSTLEHIAHEKKKQSGMHRLQKRKKKKVVLGANNKHHRLQK